MKILRTMKLMLLALVIGGALAGCIVVPEDCHHCRHGHWEHRGDRY